MGAAYSPVLAVVQMVSPLAMRGRFAALAVLMSNLFGMGFGAMLIGAITDYVLHDPQKVGLSTAIVLFAGAPITSLLIWSARRDFLRRLDSPELVAPAAGANQNAS